MSNQPSNPLKFSLRVFLKTGILFIILNVLFAIIDPIPRLGQISLYNHLFPGRTRLPYGDNPQQSYNLNLFNLEAMFASHEIANKPKPLNEFRVILIGDSSTWGYLLKHDQTLAAALNQTNRMTSDGRLIRAYNLGYPVMSLMKDLLILSYALRYEPDLIVWPVTLESFPKDKQLFAPLLINNPTPVKDLINRFNLAVSPEGEDFVQPNFFDRTIIGSRRQLADLFRLQIYGLMWTATAIDQYIPPSYIPRQEDLEADLSFHNLMPGDINDTHISVDVLRSGITLAGNIPVLIVNEPMFISKGLNSDIRYNFYYPRWAYDEFRELMQEISAQNNWNYLDLWNLVPPSEFTNSAVHLTPEGTQQFALRLMNAIYQISGQ